MNGRRCYSGNPPQRAWRERPRVPSQRPSTRWCWFVGSRQGSVEESSDDRIHSKTSGSEARGRKAESSNFPARIWAWAMRHGPRRPSREYSTPRTDLPRSRARGKAEAVKVHHLAPRCHEVTHERLMRVVACIGFRDGSELRVRAEDEVDGGAGPLDLTRPAVPPLVDVLAL